MTVTPSIDPARLIEEQLAQASPDLLRELLTLFINSLMSAEVDAVCGAAYGTTSPDRTNRRNGYRPRAFDTRAERALTSVIATCYLLGVSTRRKDKLVQSLGITSLSKSQMAKDSGVHVEQFRTRRLDDAGPFTFVAVDAPVLKVREGGRVVGVHALVATGVNADGHREVIGLQLSSTEDGAGWLGFFRDLVARGLTGVRLVTSDAHGGLVAAIGATLPGASGQRCGTHYAANLMAATPKSSWPWVKGLLHSIYDQPDAESVHAQFDRVITALATKLRVVAEHLEAARADSLAFTFVPQGDLAAGLVQQRQRAVEPGDPAPDRRRGDLPRPGLHHPPGRRRPGRAARAFGPKAAATSAWRSSPGHRPPPPANRRRPRTSPCRRSARNPTTTKD
jgi:transposase-like protein